jgi:hypothetical protein
MMHRGVFNHTQRIFKSTKKCSITFRKYLNPQKGFDYTQGIFKSTEECSITIGEYLNPQRRVQSHSENI